MTRDPLAHVRARSGGPVRLGAGVAAPSGMLRLSHADTTGQALPVWPDGVTPSLLEEYQVAPIAVERSGETRRVLAACLKCCWHDLSVDPWPGSPAPVELVLDTYRALIGRSDDLMRNWAVGALRRLHDSAWIVLSDGVVRLGPRCVAWPAEAHAQLQELVRRIPEPPRTALTVVADADIIAAITTPLPATPTPAAPSPPTPTTPLGADAGTTGPETATPTSPGTHAGATTPEADPLGAASASTDDGEPRRPHTASTPEPHNAASPGGPAIASEVASLAVAPEAASLGARPEAGSPGADDDHPRTASAIEAGAALGGRVEGGESADFDDLLGAFDERRRAELVAAYMAVEHAAEPVQEARFAALRDPALRHTLAEMLARRGRVLIQHRERWTSGYDDALAAKAGSTLGESERAVLTLVLVHSVAIPRAEGVLPEDTWLSPHPAPVDELRRHTQLPIGELESALRTLRHAGLLAQVKASEEAGGYVPGPQFHRLTPAARRRLQEELILAAGPHTPLATAVRARRSTQ